MSYAPKSLLDLRTYLSKQSGYGLSQFGIVGNTAHTGGYHLGKDRIFSSTGKGWNDYSVKLTRDKSGLTDAASAIDIKFGSDYALLRRFSTWAVDQCKKKAPGFSDIREIIYSPDGKVVWRWSGVDYQIHTGPGNGDNSHLWHTHISYFRDSENRDKVNFYSAFFGVTPPPPPQEKEMAFKQVNVPKGTWLYVSGDFSSNTNNVQIDPGRAMLLLKENAVTGGHLIVYDGNLRNYYVKKSQVTVTPLITEAECPECPPSVPGEPTEESCKVFSDAAFKSGYEKGKTEGYEGGYATGKTEGFEAGKKVGEAAGILKGVEKEQVRIKGVLGLK